MKIVVAAVFAIGVGLASMSASGAVPVAPLNQAATTGAAIIPVAGGCGPGWHRGPAGGCRPLYNCPPGWHSGPHGRRCFRNW